MIGGGILRRLRAHLDHELDRTCHDVAALLAMLAEVRAYPRNLPPFESEEQR